MKRAVDTFSYREFVDQAVNRKLHDNNSQSSRSGSEDFTQSKSFDESVKWATEGWDLGLEQYKIEDGVLTSGTTHLNPSLD